MQYLRTVIATILTVIFLCTAILISVKKVNPVEEFTTEILTTTQKQKETKEESTLKETTTKAETTEEVTTKAETTTAVESLSVEETEETSREFFNEKIIEEIKKEIAITKETTTEETTTQSSITPQEFRRAGVIYYNGYRFTYYSEKVLPGKGLKIPGRHSDGNFVRDEDNYICVASSDLPKGTVVDTPFGLGKVYDSGCASGTIDIYVSW